MKKVTLLTFLFAFQSTAFALSFSLDEISEDEKKVSEQVKVEAGGIVILEQLLEKKYSLEVGDNYLLNFHCYKKSSRKTECKLLKHEVFKKSKTR